jgi:uncharacterized protein YodC (DUF2158 family)
MIGMLKPGDRVRHTKGGPLMEVKGYNDRDQVLCSWYEAHKGWRQQPFAEHVLLRVRRTRAAAR